LISSPGAQSGDDDLRPSCFAGASHQKAKSMLDAAPTEDTLLEVSNIEVIYNHVILVG